MSAKYFVLNFNHNNERIGGTYTPITVTSIIPAVNFVERSPKLEKGQFSAINYIYIDISVNFPEQRGYTNKVYRIFEYYEKHEGPLYPSFRLKLSLDFLKLFQDWIQTITEWNFIYLDEEIEKFVKSRDWQEFIISTAMKYNYKEGEKNEGSV